jgi:hypothetical protein
MVSALAIFGGSTTLVLVGVVVWLTYRGAKAKDAQGAALDLLRGEQRVSAEWESKYKTTTAKLIASEVSRQHEADLRAVAEVQRNTAQARVRELLRMHMGTATNEEIQELTDEAFTSPLSVVPRPLERVQVPRSQDPRDGLLNPFEPEVQPAKPTR